MSWPVKILLCLGLSIGIVLMVVGVRECSSGCVSTMSRAEYCQYVYSDRYGLSSALLKGIRKQESDNGRVLWSDSTRVVSNQRWALDYPGVRTLYQKWGRRIYWCIGDYQVLYLSARDRGFRGSPMELVNIETNTKYACEILSMYLNKYDYLPNVIAAYNAGRPQLDRHGNFRNQPYVDNVLKEYKRTLPGGYE